MNKSKREFVKHFFVVYLTNISEHGKCVENDYFLMIVMNIILIEAKVFDKNLFIFINCIIIEGSEIWM